MAKRRNPQSVTILTADDEEVAAANPLPVVGTAGDAALGRVKITDGTDVADVLDLTTYNGLAVAIVDGNGDQITSFGGGTQYTEGATDATITGTAMLWEDAADTLAAVSASKPLPVEIVAGGGSGGTSAADDADFTAGTTAGTPAMGVYESTPTSVTDGDLGTVGITADRRLKVLADLSATDNAVLDNIDADLTTIIGHVDGIETALTAANASLDAIEASTAAADTDLTTIIGHVDGIETLIGTTNTTLSTIDGRVDGLEALLTTIDADTSTLAAAVATEFQVDVVGALPAGNNNIGDVDIASIAAGDNNIGNVDVVTLPSLPAGTNNIGDVDVLSIAAGTNTIGDVGVKPRTSGGLSTAMFSGSDGSSILVATAQVVKASAGQLFGYYAYNPEAAVTFVHFYNTAAASVTVGTTNPLFTLPIPAGSAANLMSDIGIVFSNAGWSVAATTTAGGNTAPATGVSLVVWYA